MLRLKGLARGESAAPIDWIAAVFTFASSGCLAVFGAFRPQWVQGFGIVAIVFGLIGMRAAGLQLWSFVRKPTEKMFWWYTHLGNFLGSYIAAWTAFSTVTLSRVFQHAGIILWVWPTAIGVPAIVLTTIYYKRKFTRPGGVAVAA